MGTVYFYKDTDFDEIITLCYYCAKQYNYKRIDKAGDWDMCSNCEAQNIPKDYPYAYSDTKEGDAQ